MTSENNTTHSESHLRALFVFRFIFSVFDLIYIKFLATFHSIKNIVFASRKFGLFSDAGNFPNRNKTTSG